LTGDIEMNLSSHIAPRGAPRTLLPLVLVMGGCSSHPTTPEQRPDTPTAEEPSDPSDPSTPEEPTTVTPHPERGTALGGNASGVHGCDEGQGSYHHYEQPTAEGTAQLHVIAVVQSDEAAEDPEGSGEGDIDVHITRSGPSVLVLSATTPTTWNVTAEPEAKLDRVIVSGYYAQSATVPEGVRLDITSLEQTGKVLGPAEGFQWPSHFSAKLIDAGEELTGATLTSFRGCHTSASFQIDEAGELRPPHPVSSNPERAVPRGCEQVTSESAYCVGLGSGQVVAFGLDSGDVCQGPGVEGLGFLPESSSLGWQGDYIYSCDPWLGFARVSVIDGTVDIAPIDCGLWPGLGVTTHAGGLLARVPKDFADPLDGVLARFADFDHLVGHEPEHVFDFDPEASRVAVHGDQAYFAWHSIPAPGDGHLGVETLPLVDGAELTTIVLEGFDNWVMGMDVIDGGELVLASWFDTEGIYVFDAGTGAFERLIQSELPSLFVQGFECQTGAAGDRGASPDRNRSRSGSR
jgi:hypothetical protein